jgi:hypothetical protein
LSVKTVKTILGTALWLIGGLTSVAVVNDFVTAIRTGSFPGPLGVVGALLDGILPLILMVSAYFLTHSHLRRRNPRIVLGTGLAIALLFEIHVSYLLRP